MTQPGRNDPCHCGSGKKYKHCHLRADESANPAEPPADEHEGAAPRALAWLVERHRKAFKTAFEERMSELLPNASARNRIDAQVADSLQTNLLEWLLADGELLLKGERRRVLDVLLGPGGPLFEVGQRRWLEQFAERPLALYTITEVRPGEGATLCDALDAQAAPLAVIERTGSRSMQPGLLIGCRVMQQQDKLVLSGAMYGFSKPATARAIDAVRAAQAQTPDAKRRRLVVARAIAHEWLRQFTEARVLPQMIDAPSGEPLLLITDHYRVLDAQALARSLAACADVKGDAKGGWRREFEGKDGDPRSSAVINPGKSADRIELFYRTQRYADEGRPWFEAVAGPAVRFITRELSDPRGALSAGKGRGATAEPPLDLPPEVMTQAVQQAMLRVYANWADEPVPALDGRTPRQAIATAPGLERVKGLMREYEAGEEEQASRQGRAPVSFQFLWDQLGIAR